MARGGHDIVGQESVTVLLDLLLLVTGLTLICIALPLAFARTAVRRSDGALLAFFAAIGLGFMLVEISMLQRLIIFLGHPIYSLSLILFTLLLAGGIGSRLSVGVADERLHRHGLALLAVLAIVLAAAGAAVGPLIGIFQGAEGMSCVAGSTPCRISR